jgi:hypothetical protein
MKVGACNLKVKGRWTSGCLNNVIDTCAGLAVHCVSKLHKP